MNKNELLLKPKIDVVFHALFRRANNTLLEAMLSAILETKVKIIANLDRHLDIATADEKLGVMDLRVQFEDGTYCNVEIQLKPYKYENERFLYYLSDTYSRQLERGDEYQEIQKTISIVIVDHETEALKGIEDLNVRWQMRDNATGGRMLTDRFELVIIELPKARRIYGKSQDNKISQWMMFLDNPNSKEVTKIMDKNEDIKKAKDELKQVSGDYELRRIAELKEKYIRDEAAALDYAIEKGQKEGFDKGMKDGLEQGLKEGIEKGIEKGIEQGIERGIERGIEQGIKQEKINAAKNMLKLDIEIEKIVKVTGLTAEKILKLK